MEERISFQIRQAGGQTLDAYKYFRTPNLVYTSSDLVSLLTLQMLS